jgi:hypothetical protein
MDLIATLSTSGNQDYDIKLYDIQLYDIQLNDIQSNDIQHNIDTQHNGLKCDNKHRLHSA